MDGAKIVASWTLYAGKFIGLDEITYTDDAGTLRRWESAVRRGDVKAVMIVPVIRPSGELVMIRQFRPPVGQYVWETPAGLIEPGEDPAAAGVRELYEETGFEGRITKFLPAATSSSGLSGESVHIAFMEIDGARYPEGTLPEAHPDPEEHIGVYRVKLEKLSEFLLARIAGGDAVDSKLLLFSELSASAGGAFPAPEALPRG